MSPELEPVLQLRERGAARIELLVVVRMGRVVQIAAADGAQPGAVGPAEDLFRKLEDERVARPAREVELVVLEIWRAQLLRVRARRLVLPRRDDGVDDGVGEAAVARPVETALVTELEDGAARDSTDDELGLHLLRNGQVTLAAQPERLERDLLLVPVLLARTELHGTQAEARHTSQVSAGVSGGIGETQRCAAGPRCSPRGGVLLAPIVNCYRRSVRPCLGTTIAPRRRATFRQSLLVVTPTHVVNG